jgi:hypothetical protein
MADYPPIDRSYVVSYAANDRDYPIIGIKRDPRTAGYKVPEDLSPHPDSKRYPNHVFTDAQPASGDQVVTHIYEILPAPWVPFTRYDDDLGPVQGRRRAVKNEGQQADLAADKKVSYEGRDGSAIVSNEIEETWSIKTDEDGNSLFPIKDRDFYDASRGAVQERRQLFVPTGEEEGSLENVNGVITQTSYEPYNEFLSVKIVQTYKVDGPQLIGKATNNEGQLTTITTQRKAALDYIPPSPTATRTVEASREDAESLVERIIDTPEVFGAETFSIERPDPAPEKFRVELPTTTEQQTVEGIAEEPTLDSNDLSKSEQQQTKFTKRTSTTKRDTTPSGTLIGRQTGTWGDETVTETYNEDGSIDTGYKILSNKKTPLGGGKFLGERVEVDSPTSLTEVKKDAETGIVYTTTKSLVAAGISLPATSANQIAEISPIDAYNSIQIITTVNNLPSPETFETSLDISYPDVLEEIGVLWQTSQSGSGNTSGIDDISEVVQNVYSWSVTASADAYSDVRGNVYIKIKDGHSGKVRTQVTRTYYSSPPTNNPTTTQFRPVRGTVLIKGTGLSIKNNSSVSGKGDVRISSGGGSEYRFETFANSITFGPVVHSGITLTGAIPPDLIGEEYTSIGGGLPSGGTYPVAIARATAEASAELFLPTSSQVFNTGSSHIALVRVEKWRLGVWIQEVYTAFHP